MASTKVLERGNPLIGNTEANTHTDTAASP